MAKSPWRVVLLLSAMLYLPSLFFGFFTDDYTFISVLKTDAIRPRKWVQLYSFTGVPEYTQFLFERGLIPWYTAPDLRLNFFRPLSSALLSLDHSLFGTNALGWHLHSLLWGAALLIGVVRLFLRVLPPELAYWAAIVFTLSSKLVLPIVWISNRNALVAVVPVVWGLLAHMRARENGWHWGFLLGPLGLIVGLCAAEVAISAAAYLAAYECFAAPGDRRRRALGLAPYVFVLACYLAYYKMTGHGTAAAGFYLDPFSDTWAYLQAVPLHLGVLLGSAFGSLPADFWLVLGNARPIFAAIGFVVAGGAFILFRRLALRQGLWQRTLWLVAGAFASIIPVLSTVPMDRLLLSAMIGFSVVLAVFVEHALNLRRQRRIAHASLPPLRSRLYPMYITISVLILSPLFAFGQLVGGRSQALEIERSTLASELDDSTVREAIILAAPDHIVPMYLPSVRVTLDRYVPYGWHTLSSAPYDHVVTRTSENSLALKVIGGVMQGSVLESVFRNPRRAWAIGDRVQQRFFTAEILAVSEGLPTQVGFTFDKSLNEPEVGVFVWRDQALRRVAPMAIGESWTLVKVPGPSGL